ncbi:hypothetical protein JCGZ_13427 [Jatropha curcas]|uniref:GDP-D-glucose phosphorylase 1 n=1 Tax=Jatropha curcas TaxID=180498 RepID=A0A067KAI4_JATCU|nr:hypothetical protein JCGZ_13427 [Jatropha curcas]
MLTIKKVPTVVSNYQEENSERNLEGCGRNCLGNCCLPDTEKSIENGMVRSSQDRQQAQICFLHNLLLGQWEDRMTRGLFRYDVTTCQSTIIPGRYGFIAQLNEGRHLKKRPTEFRVDKVLQDFDESKFNFNKIGQEEVLFRFEHGLDDKKSEFFPTAPASVDSNSPNVVAINVSPIEYGHVLLIPRILDCLPQRIDSESFLLAVYLAKEASDPFFRVGYNSLGAFATINHLHFQAYYLAVSFPVEKAPTKRITLKGTRDKGVVVSRLLNYPVKGLVFEGGNTIEDLSDSVSSSCIYLQNNNVPFNVLIADCGNRIFLFPQCYAEKQALGEVSQELLNTQVNPAVWEVSGHIVLKRRKDFEDASEAYIWRLLAEVSVSEERFQEVTTRVLEAAGFEEVKKTNHEDEYQLSPKAISHFPSDCVFIH